MKYQKDEYREKISSKLTLFSSLLGKISKDFILNNIYLLSEEKESQNNNEKSRSKNNFYFLSEEEILFKNLIDSWREIALIDKKIKKKKTDYRNSTDELNNFFNEKYTLALHEIKNELLLIKSIISYLKAYSKKDPDIKKPTEKLEKAEKNIEGIIKEYTKSSYKDEKSSNLNDTISQFWSDIRMLCKETKICCIKDVEKNLPTLIINPLFLHEILINLSNNAIEEMQEKGGILFFSAKKEEKKVIFKIEDTGKGIDKSIINKIYDKNISTKPGSLGLGLYIAKKLTEANNGKIKVKSEKGRGTTFTVEFPLNPLP